MFSSYFIKRKIRSLAKRAAGRPCHAVSLDDARSLLVFYDSRDHEAVMRALEPLRKAGKSIDTCVYVAEEASFPEDDTSILIRPGKDLDIWGFPSASFVERVNTSRADILIDVTRPDRYASQYLVLGHPSPFKVGIKYAGQEWYDLGLVVTDTKDISYLFGQILFYLRSIRAK